MTRDELEHIIRASADVTDQYEFIIVGSQSILGPVPNPPEVFTMSAEADIYPLHAGTTQRKEDRTRRLRRLQGAGDRRHLLRDVRYQSCRQLQLRC